jgi:hypothetical protein
MNKFVVVEPWLKKQGFLFVVVCELWQKWNRLLKITKNDIVLAYVLREGYLTKRPETSSLLLYAIMLKPFFSIWLHHTTIAMDFGMGKFLHVNFRQFYFFKKSLAVINQSSEKYKACFCRYARYPQI